MNEGAPLMYHGNASFSGPSTMYMVQGHGDRQQRQYPVEMLQVIGGVHGSPGQGTPRRCHKNRQIDKDNAFGYESDDSSLSSSASGSNKSSEKDVNRSDASLLSSPSVHPQLFGDREQGENWRQERGAVAREWRARRREPRPRRAAPDRYLAAHYPAQVKFAPDDLLNGSQWDMLSQEIWDKFVKSQQTEETFRKKMNLWRYLHITIKSIFPRYGLYVVGSTMSGFGLESSDMDLCLHVRPPAGTPPALPPRHHALLHLHHVLHHIRGLDPDAELIQAKVPILKFRDARHGLQVDLNCDNVVGVRNTGLLYGYARADWRVRPLVAVAKLWARAHHINDARNRTLSSYALTLMVLHYLQCGTSPAVLPRAGEAATGRQNRATLAELFLGLLKYYAEFPWRQYAVSVRARRVPLWEARARAPDPTRWKLICVEEPFDLSNTAHSVYDPDTFEVIVNTFRESHARLAASLQLRDAWPQR
ncbi:poly(A) RNA polymerase gld-2 homolog A-like [Aricia agestis]|uniref:poly(A) RNA polymerase gld-2 homolog A-like n=1 Tax=Aricia agestis TaxID=91739 RepID=UPI001C20517D|nr:poly(A) RNA polymerase gld-2 homolog A-like [Aricia agestis]XP_041981045.1 poly(A) RNA polymerase gld-2 homolog A-like [Aricia agestis]